mmetsp:Transcript_11693/g.18821  ORF Transcript_11693/g.18821 Transcript_11693/m.18821 type:complete len:366 (-) Transcript_11693:11-1108(-)
MNNTAIHVTTPHPTPVTGLALQPVKSEPAEHGPIAALLARQVPPPAVTPRAVAELGGAGMNTPAGSKQEVLNMPSHVDIAGGDETPPSQASGDDSRSNLSPERQACDLERAFMVAFRASHVANGVDFDKLTSTLNRRLYRTKKPFDMFGLYCAVTSRGGFVARPVARRHLSMVEIFREMTNHYEDHTYTDIGTLLLNTYEKFFLQYEQAHPEDIAVSACSVCGETGADAAAGTWAECEECRARTHVACTKDGSATAIRLKGGKVRFLCDTCCRGRKAAGAVAKSARASMTIAAALDGGVAPASALADGSGADLSPLHHKKTAARRKQSKHDAIVATTATTYTDTTDNTDDHRDGVARQSALASVK